MGNSVAILNVEQKRSIAASIREEYESNVTKGISDDELKAILTAKYNNIMASSAMESYVNMQKGVQDHQRRKSSKLLTVVRRMSGAVNTTENSGDSLNKSPSSRRPSETTRRSSVNLANVAALAKQASINATRRGSSERNPSESSLNRQPSTRAKTPNAEFKTDSTDDLENSTGSLNTNTIPTRRTSATSTSTTSAPLVNESSGKSRRASAELKVTKPFMAGGKSKVEAREVSTTVSRRLSFAPKITSTSTTTATTSATSPNGNSAVLSPTKSITTEGDNEEGGGDGSGEQQVDSWESVVAQSTCSICNKIFPNDKQLDNHVKFSQLHAMKLKELNPAPKGSIQGPIVQDIPEDIGDASVLYTGSKFFWRTRDTLELHIYQHIGSTHKTMEIIPFDFSTHEEMERLYLDMKMIILLMGQELIDKKLNELEQERLVQSASGHGYEMSIIPPLAVRIEEATRAACTSYTLARIQVGIIESEESNSKTEPKHKYKKKLVYTHLLGDDPLVKPTIEFAKLLHHIEPVTVGRKRRTSQDEIAITEANLNVTKVEARRSITAAEANSESVQKAMLFASKSVNENLTAATATTMQSS
eukprot:gene8708-17993_t